MLEMPLVETIPGPDRDQLPAVLQEGAFDWVVITSPEAAAVFLKGWEAAGQPEVISLCLQVPSGPARPDRSDEADPTGSSAENS